MKGMNTFIFLCKKIAFAILLCIFKGNSKKNTVLLKHNVNSVILFDWLSAYLFTATEQNKTKPNTHIQTK